MRQPSDLAPGWPGIPPRWTSSAKDGVGTALSSNSRIWFTVSHGILNEVYFGRIDQACVRDLGLIVTDGRSFFSEEKRDTDSRVEWLADGVPGYRVTNTCRQGRFRIEKELVTDPAREVLLMRVRFVPLSGAAADYRLFALLAPHLGNQGSDNTGWIGEHNGLPMLFASAGPLALALACDVPWRERSVGYVGFSDGWQQLSRDLVFIETFVRAEHGNVALTGEVDVTAGDEFVLALGFGRDADEAASKAAASLNAGFERIQSRFIDDWLAWQQSLRPLDRTPNEVQAIRPSTPTRSASEGTYDTGAHPTPSSPVWTTEAAPATSAAPRPNLYRVSAAMIRAHDAKEFPGGVIASLSIPWGFSKGDDDLGGYHLVWPRDLVEAAGGLLAAGAHAEAIDVLDYLETTQQADGHWPQNMWLDGTPYWHGVQMDETALPILLVDVSVRAGALTGREAARYWPMVRRAAQYLVVNGPVTQQDRWEEDPGYNPFTLAAEIAGLLAAADMADDAGDSLAACYLRETADLWNHHIERWTYARDGELAREHGVDGYYVRIAPPETSDAASPLDGFVAIKNRPPDHSSAPARQIVGTDFLALVRFGLRAADDPRILNTLRVVDAHLKTEFPCGPGWHRYSGDGYGEHDDGSPFNGTGVGRVWPLFTGERAHYELAADRRTEAERLLHALEAMANGGGLIPEQTWDAADVRQRGLYFGRPAGSAMPLVWAHGEYIKLLRSLADGAVFDMPPQTRRRYVEQRRQSPHSAWRFNHKCRRIAAGKRLRIEVQQPALVHWGRDGWQDVQDAGTRDTTLGMHVVDLPTDRLPRGSTIEFTFYWPGVARWEGADFSVRVEG